VYFCVENEKPTPSAPDNSELPELFLTPAQMAVVNKQKANCGCAGKRNGDVVQNATSYTKKPTDDCWQCAEKHLGTAYTLYSKESGYAELNHLHYIGELNSAQQHIFGISRRFAEEIRAFRHDIQIGIKKNDQAWQTLTKNFYDIKDSTATVDLLSGKFNKVYVFSNVASATTAPVTKDDLLVFLNKAVNAEKYIDHPHKICFHRSDKPEYGKRRFDMRNAYVFGKNGIPEADIRQIKADYDWNYEIEEGKVKSCTTGYMVALHLAKRFPEAELILVNFGLDVPNSTYRCPWHNWEFEDKALKKYTMMKME
jgi:hypothetical protein